MTQTVDTTATPAPDPRPEQNPAAGLEASPPEKKKRDHFFDNVKFLAIILVVVGHVLEDLRDVPAADATYLFIYMFHMPVFIVLAGYFSRNFTFSGGKARKLITNLGVPYVVFETAYSVYHWAVNGAALKITLLDPYYLTWFLMALFAWRLSTPVWQQIRWPLGIAVVIALLSGMNDLPNELDMQRMLGLLPYYVLGLMLRPEQFAWLKRPVGRVLGALTLIGGLGISFLATDRMTTEWAYWRKSNGELGVDDLTGTLMRLGVLAAGMVLVMAFLAITPAHRTWFSGLGTATLYAYLLHGFATKLMEFQGWYDAEWLHTLPGVAIAALTAALLATLLCTPPVRKVMRWALEPKMPWAFTPLRKPQTVTTQTAATQATTIKPHIGRHRS